MVFVSHDIGAAVDVAGRIAGMQAGRIVEQCTARQRIREPCHPDTQALLQRRSQGVLAKGGRPATMAGSAPDRSQRPPGGAFAERCALAVDACRQRPPAPVILSPGHQARCLRTEDTARVALPARN